jgi:endonuclease YncB( thermonuclease family)
MFITLKHFALPQRGGALVLAAACFAAGLTVGRTAGALIAPVGASLGTNLGVEFAAPVEARHEPATGGLRSAHPAEVLRVIDGDTFEARDRIWPGMDVTTRGRLRGIDAPEMHACCEDERVKAIAARDALMRILNEDTVGIVDADVSTLRTPDVSATLFELGLARRYSGGRRKGWCG